MTYEIELPRGITRRIGDDGHVYSAPTAEAALAFAQEQQSQGVYQFFRGQENSSWQPITSWARVSPERKESVTERVNQFLGYTRRVAKESGIEYSNDALVGIAQHYGLPTTFLDLTTDPVVAAMFACPSNTQHRERNAAIFLYSEAHLCAVQELIKSAAGGENRLELIRIDVANLWRLQAQRGLFLWVGLTNLSTFFEPHRIEFPHPQDGIYRAGYDLYPTEKSALEQQLDLYFHLEASDAAKVELRKIVPHNIQIKNNATAVLNTTPRLATAIATIAEEWLTTETSLHETLRDGIEPIGDWPLRTLPNAYWEAGWKYRTGKLSPHPSWFGQSAMEWLRTAVEAYQPIEESDLPMEVDLSLYSEIQANRSGLQPRVLFAQGVAKRHRSARFRVTYSPWQQSEKASRPAGITAGPSEIETRFGVVAQVLWDGIRSKPLSDELVECCMDRYFARARFFLDCYLRDEPSRWRADLGNEYVDHLRVEFAAIGGHSRVVETLCSSLEKCVRADFDQWIEVVLPNDPPRFRHLTQMIYPQYLFDFDRFVELYCGEMLPFAAFVGAITWMDNLGLAFNPRHIKVFGLA